MRKSLVLLCIVFSSILLIGCKKVEIFVEPEPDYMVEVKETEMDMDWFYVKNGTKFGPVYMPAGNATGKSKKVNKSRVIYFQDDEKMVPTHYKGELLAYASAKASLSDITLERFYDIGYSLGFWGGEIKEDGYYHITAGKENVVPGSSANEVFNCLPSKEIRIISISNTPIADIIDEGSGIVLGLKPDEKYVIELYAGTYYYKYYINADVHMMRSYEVYNYQNNYINDTTHGYMCFNTPENLKSGWYLVNGQGLMKYYSEERGSTLTTNDLNEEYYKSEEESLASYSKAYTVSIPTQTQDLDLVLTYEDSVEESAITANVVSPAGDIYEMSIDENKNKLKLSLVKAMPGDWKIYVYPMELAIVDTEYYSTGINEETTLSETEFAIEEPKQYQMFQVDIEGNHEKVYGAIVTETGKTYQMEMIQEKGNETKKDKYSLRYQLPYMEPGTYTVKIYYYKSMTTISSPILYSYESSNSEEIIVIE